MLLLAAVPSFIISLRGITDPTTVSTDIGVLELLATVAAAAGPPDMAIYQLWRDRRLQSAGFAKRGAGFVLGYGAIGWVACFIALIAASIVIGSLYAAFGGDLDALTESDDDGVTLTAASLVIAGVIALTAGLTEEIVFRAYAITRLEELGWKKAAVIVPTVVFTVLHLYQGILGMLFIGAIASVLAWLYKWRRSIWPVMVAHALFDAVQLTIAALSN
jgi:membrane protease YdiL (CAAX protease family)